MAICAIPSAVLAGQYTVTYNFESPEIKNLGNSKQVLMMENTFADTRNPGAPIVPAKLSNIYIPEGEQVVDITVYAEDTYLLPGLYDIAPTQVPTRFGDIQKYTKEDPSIYQDDSWYPGINYQEVRTRKLRGTNIFQTRLFPIQYNPVNGSVEFSQKITVTIETETVAQPASLSLNNSPSYRNLGIDNDVIRSSIDNVSDFGESYFATASASPTAGERDYVVITTSALASAFQTLTDYRETSEGGGYSTYIETIDQIEVNYTGRDRAEKIRNFIIDQYNNYGTQFVLLGGDADGPLSSQQIPTRGGNIMYDLIEYYHDDNIPSDYYYACLDGDWNSDGDELWGEPTDGIDGGDIDLDPEISVGRIAADTANEALNQINKIITFENRQNPSYKALILGERLDSATLGGDAADIVYTHSNNMPRQKLYDRSRSEGEWSSSDVIPLINSNQFNMINHVGHSAVHLNLRLRNEDVSQLTNSDPLLIFSEGCYSGAFDNRKMRTNMTEESYYDASYDSIAEELTVGTEYGAFAYIGNSRYGWYNVIFRSEGSTLVHSKFVNALIKNNINPIGVALNTAKSQIDHGDATNRWNTFDVNLLGDPASRINRNCQSTDLILTNLTDRRPIDIGESILLKAKVAISCSNSLYKQATVTADFDNGDESINLYDDGTNGDEVAGDGTYSSTWTPQDNQTPVWVTLTASDPSYNSESENFGIVVEDPYVCEQFTDTNVQHESEGRAYSATETQGQTCFGTFCFGGTEVTTWYAQGSNDDLGTNGSAETTLHTEPGGIFALGICTAPDNTPPVVTILGDNPMTVYQGSTFVDPGAEATDNRDGDITDRIQVIINEVDTSTIGEYQIHYLAIDAAGNGKVEVRIVNVVEKPDCENFSDTVINHETAGRAYSTTTTEGQTCYGTFCFGGTEVTTWFAQGSNENLGTSGSAVVTLSTNPNGSGFVTGQCQVENLNRKPVINSHDYSVNRNIITFTGTASDPDGDLAKVMLALGINQGIDCEGTTNFTCTYVAPEPGTYTVAVVALDSNDNYSEFTDFYEIVIEEQGEVECITDTNYNHVEAGRAYRGGSSNLYAYATGSGDDLGLYGSTYYSATTSLEETSAGFWELVDSCN